MVGGRVVDAGDEAVVRPHCQGGRVVDVCSGETVVAVSRW